ncbi:lipid II:glycine glycyltransferase FemX [Kineosporia mesophila]|uniref:lipid II:glycine glycyltransferase FemX n=1 Tax=Kineosporia mesophila TaxID=566012 RepID=UPI001E5F7D86|nr:peptidoglycan bridge formation glycyltransferase FemA/FemB family protein [Kineosporia mesophila]MCD5352929.1 peptidoglycan bridge formation glycyltransferase FemA/FemB family protein [Kineosporia mesophila]
MPGTDARSGTALWPAQHAGLTVLPISAADHERFAVKNSASITQTPAWGGVKKAWRNESLGWIENGEVIGTALVLYRPVPGTGRSLAYIPEGPTLPWDRVLKAPSWWLSPFLDHLRGQHAFAVRMGPTQPTRYWSTATAKRGLSAEGVTRFSELAPDETYPDGAALQQALKALGWVSLEDESGQFTAGQPRLGVRVDMRDRTPEQLLKNMNQQWRRNVKKSAAAGVIVRQGDLADLPIFHRLYVETGERDGFTPRPAGYFTTMWRALNAGPETVLRLWISEYEGEPLAAALTVDVDRTCWYTYGASTSRHREVQAPTAMQWTSMRAALGRGNWVYDFRGIADTLDENERLAGLLRFKLGAGGHVVETVGEWEFTLSPLWQKAFQTYQKVQAARS